MSVDVALSELLQADGVGVDGLRLGAGVSLGTQLDARLKQRWLRSLRRRRSTRGRGAPNLETRELGPRSVAVDTIATTERKAIRRLQTAEENTGTDPEEILGGGSLNRVPTPVVQNN